jgi:hypothetical protein
MNMRKRKQAHRRPCFRHEQARTGTDRHARLRHSHGRSECGPVVLFPAGTNCSVNIASQDAGTSACLELLPADVLTVCVGGSSVCPVIGSRLTAPSNLQSSQHWAQHEQPVRSGRGRSRQVHSAIDGRSASYSYVLVSGTPLGSLPSANSLFREITGKESTSVRVTGRWDCKL